MRAGADIGIKAGIYLEPSLSHIMPRVPAHLRIDACIYFGIASVAPINVTTAEQCHLFMDYLRRADQRHDAGECERRRPSDEGVEGENGDGGDD